jgi:hypothetical protein
MGPAFRGVVFAACQGSTSSKELLDDCFAKSPFNPAACSLVRSRVCVTMDVKAMQDSNVDDASSLTVPKVDLISTLPGDILVRMVSTSIRLPGQSSKLS